MNLLIVEDDAHIQQFLQQGFEQEGCSTTLAKTGVEGLHYATQEHYDVVVLDLMLPEMDGMTLLRQLRGQGHNVPVIILSAKHSVQERVTGLQCGADDYLVKPFAFTELMARCQSISRRGAREPASPTLLSFDELSLDLIRRELVRGEERISLNKREFALAELFLRNPEKVMSKTAILEQVWGYQFDPQTNVVDVLVCRLRNKVDKSFNHSLIHTIRGVGYVLRKEC
ncbi:transcriptional regulator [Grimontia sp. AD028]|uniref:response regulator transcription factor n=1 Tax=Grimontia sp. AD028 TaxID=1581149 RepID=UPI00061AE167|nr:response regulator transcription factor [Grimontia sp. AD028]KKD58026.1 transcriptional regulator [Grimontia sp. AD028]